MAALSILRFACLLLVAVLAGQCAEIDRVTILHLNDLHARLLPDEDRRGGFAHLATAIESERRTAENVILLHAGDMVQGSPVSTIFKGTPIFEVANSLGIDAHCLGNHEFDYGWEQIRDFERVAESPILAANVINTRGEHLVRPAITLSAGGLRVAVIGALTPRLRRLIKPDQAGPWQAAPLVESLREIVSEVNREADLVVVLGHLFDDEDEEILRRLPDVDVLISGHDHGGRQRPLVIDGRVGVKLRAYGRELGRLDIALDRASGQVVDYDWKRIPIHQDRYAANAEVAAVVERWESKVSELVDIPVAQSARPFNRDEVKALVEQALRESTGAAIAYMNRGGVRDSLSAGTVSARHVWNILPFDNAIVEATVPGRTLPAEALAGKRVDPDRQYRFVTNDYVAGLAEFRHIQFRTTEVTLRDAFLDWVKARAHLP